MFSLTGLASLIWQGAYPRVKHLKGGSQRQVLAIIANIRQAWKGLLGANTLVYYKHP
jgi:hypothetical protein